MAQIRQVVSETLQATIRRLLPSQQGFSEDLQASNVITPIIDLTPSAEGSALDTDLARALAYDSQTAFSVNNTSAVVANSPGFYRIYACASAVSQDFGGTVQRASITMSDGLSTKTIWQLVVQDNNNSPGMSENIDIIVFLSSGDSVSVVSNDTQADIVGSSRQVADVNGQIVVPSGFVQQ